jgi:preprotein translocase subunit SecF
VSTVDTTISNPTVKRSLWHRLYNGQTTIEFVRRWPRWFAISGLVILLGLGALAARGLTLGIDFKGGTVWQLPANSKSVADTRDAIKSFGLGQAKIQTISSGGKTYLRIQGDKSKPAEARKVVTALAKFTGVKENDVNVQSVGPSWGKDVSKKARQALVVFFALIAIYISFRFEWKMALAAIIAVAHDILVTVGIYALSGFEVTPATVIAFLTILGYSLYDTIVVFDKVEENVDSLGNSGRHSYTDLVNLSMNQVLMRSINTSLVAILPVLSMLVLGAGLMGATALGDFGLALFVGLLTGAYSSIFIASPLLAIFKEREQRWTQVRDRMGASRRAPVVNADGTITASKAAVDAVSALTGGATPRPRKAGKR